MDISSCDCDNNPFALIALQFTELPCIFADIRDSLLRWCALLHNEGLSLEEITRMLQRAEVLVRDLRPEITLAGNDL